MSTSFTTLTVQKRSTIGKGGNRRLRAQGIIPAVFYSPGGENVPIQVAEAAFKKIFEKLGRTTVFNIEIEDNEKKSVFPTLIWDLDYYPVKNRIQHVDFFGVDLNKELKVRVPLEFAGTAVGTKLGGVMETFFEHIDVFSKPLALPNKIIVDVTSVELGQTLRVGDLSLPEGVRAATDASVTLLSVHTPSAETEESAASAAAE